MNISLDKLKEDMINKVIAELKDMRYMTENERNLYVKQLVEKMQRNILVTVIREQHELTNADDYNQTAYEMYLDLLTTFGYINSLYESISAHQKLNESIINTLTSNIAILNDKLDEYESALGSIGAPKCYREAFRTMNNQETDRKYYKERYGERMPLETYVKFNSEQENITLNYTRQRNLLTYKSGVQLGEIDITRQYGAGFIKVKNQETRLENCVNTNPLSYWSETILSDAEIKIQGLGFENPDGLSRTNRSFYNSPRGALCEICITFEAFAKLNEVVLTPYGNFPIDILAIRYTLSDEEDAPCYDVIYPNHEDPLLASRAINKEYAFRFPEINCKKVYILINQLHCIKDTYMLSSNQLFKNELWFNATFDNKATLKHDNSIVFRPIYLDKAEEKPIWKYINNRLVQSKNLDINDLLIKNEEKYIPVTKYQYTYGFYNISPNFSQFQQAGIYVSKEIEVQGSISSIELITDETHYNGTDGGISTDIEFYITSKKDPLPEDWHSICPKNKPYVYRELLQLDYAWCYLRHKAAIGSNVKYNENGIAKVTAERPIVYKDDITLIEDIDYILRYDSDGACIAVEIQNIDMFAMYTCSYTPMDTEKELSLIDPNTTIPSNTFEELMGNGTAMYRLSEFPYYSRINPDSTSSFLKIIDVKTNHVFSEALGNNKKNNPIQCVTDKTNPANSYKNFVANSNKIQYYTNGRYLYLSQPITADQKIEINYPSLGSKIRLKAILRRNTKYDKWMTPVLNSYELQFHVL